MSREVVWLPDAFGNALANSVVGSMKESANKAELEKRLALVVRLAVVDRIAWC